LADVVTSGLGLIARSKDYALLDLPEVKAALARPPVEVCTHPESGANRALFDCPEIALTPTGPRVRLIVAAHEASSSPPAIGVQREGMVYELFVTALATTAFTAKDVLDLYLHRGAFETVLADARCGARPGPLVFSERLRTGILAASQPMDVESSSRTWTASVSRGDALNRICSRTPSATCSRH
jgi:hypothetical protein